MKAPKISLLISLVIGTSALVGCSGKEEKTEVNLQGKPGEADTGFPDGNPKLTSKWLDSEGLEQSESGGHPSLSN